MDIDRIYSMRIADQYRLFSKRAAYNGIRAALHKVAFDPEGAPAERKRNVHRVMRGLRAKENAKARIAYRRELGEDITPEQEAEELVKAVQASKYNTKMNGPDDTDAKLLEAEQTGEEPSFMKDFEDWKASGYGMGGSGEEKAPAASGIDWRRLGLGAGAAAAGGGAGYAVARLMKGKKLSTSGAIGATVLGAALGGGAYAGGEYLYNNMNA